MATTVSLTRAYRHENEAQITGVESQEVNGVIHLNQIISLGTEEVIAGGVGFTIERLQSLGLSCSGDVACQFLGTKYAIVAILAGPPGTIQPLLDLTELIFAGDWIRVRDSNTAGNDGIYQVDTVAAALITCEAGCTLVTDADPAGGTVQKIMSAQLYNLMYEIATTAAQTITYAGDLTDIFAIGDLLVMTGTANDEIWEVTLVATDGPPVTTTTLTLTNLGGVGVLGASGAGVGEFQKFRPAFTLVANSPMIWSIEGGTNNPLQDAVNTTDFPLQGVNAEVLVNNAGAENVTFKGRVATNAVL